MVLNMFVMCPNRAIDIPIPIVAAVNERIRGTHPGHAEAKNDGIIARYPNPFL